MHARITEKKWKIGIATLVAFFVCALVATMIVAAQNVKVTEPDYYRQGIKYDEQRKSTANATGWKIYYFVQNEILRVKMTDAAGIPVSGAEVYFFKGLAPEKSVKAVSLGEYEPGVYQGTVKTSGTGQMRGTIKIKRGEDKISQKIAIFH